VNVGRRIRPATAGPNVRVPLASGSDAGPVTATIRPLTGAEEASARDAGNSATQSWITGLLATVVLELGDRTPDEESLHRLSVGDRNALLIGAILATYGPRLRWQIDCECGESLDVEVDLGELLARDPAALARTRAELPPGARLPTGADLEAVADAVEVEAAWVALVVRCCGARKPDEAELASLEEQLAKADPLCDITLRPVCWKCHLAVPMSLDPAIELAARLASWTDLLYDVRALALAYGWTEPDVLALPRPRRSDHLLLLVDGDE
jgi:hypothetical protein